MLINIKVSSSSFDSEERNQIFTIFNLLNARSQLTCVNDKVKR